MATTLSAPAAPDPRSLADRAYLHIRDQLIMLEIRPGDPINDDRLAQYLAIGRTPVREALKRLEQERLVVAHPRRGTFATDVNITDLRHIFEVRQQLEPIAATIAAQRATTVDRDRLTELLERLAPPAEPGKRHATAPALKPVSTPSELMALDLAVHRAIYAATHNPYLEDTLVHYDNLATRIWCLFTDQLPDLAGHVDEHAPLLHAILDGAADNAGELAARHVARFESAIRAVI